MKTTTITIVNGCVTVRTEDGAKTTEIDTGCPDCVDGDDGTSREDYCDRSDCLQVKIERDDLAFRIKKREAVALTELQDAEVDRRVQARHAALIEQVRLEGETAAKWEREAKKLHAELADALLAERHTASR